MHTPLEDQWGVSVLKMEHDFDTGSVQIFLVENGDVKILQFLQEICGHGLINCQRKLAVVNIEPRIGILVLVSLSCGFSKFNFSLNHIQKVAVKPIRSSFHECLIRIVHVLCQSAQNVLVSDLCHF